MQSNNLGVRIGGLGEAEMLLGEALLQKFSDHTRYCGKSRFLPTINTVKIFFATEPSKEPGVERRY